MAVSLDVSSNPPLITQHVVTGTTPIQALSAALCNLQIVQRSFSYRIVVITRLYLSGNPRPEPATSPMRLHTRALPYFIIPDRPFSLDVQAHLPDL